MSSTSDHKLIRDALIAGGVAAVDGPAKTLPTKPDGTVAQFAVLWPSARLHQYTRAVGTQSGRLHRLTITCGGATLLDALAVADKVEAAIGGMRLPGSGGTLCQTLASTPAAEPNTNPVRVSCAVEYSTITKG